MITLYNPCGCEVDLSEGDHHAVAFRVCGPCHVPCLQLGLALSASDPPTHTEDHHDETRSCLEQEREASSCPSGCTCSHCEAEFGQSSWEEPCPGRVE